MFIWQYKRDSPQPLPIFLEQTCCGYALKHISDADTIYPVNI